MGNIGSMVVVVGLALAGPALAQQAPIPVAPASGAGTGAAVTVVAKPKNDDVNYEGDRIWFRSPQLATLLTYDTMGSEGCLRVGQPMIARKAMTAGAVSGWKLAVVKSRWSDPVGGCPKKGKDEVTPIETGVDVFIPDAVMNATDRARTGWTYGALLVPYKYQIGGDKEFSPSASLGGYLGWRFENVEPVSMKVALFAGATMIPMAELDASGKPTATIGNRPGFSTGLAFLGTIKSSFQLGLVIGVDHAGKSAKYVNQDKPWVAFSLGYDFAN